MTTVAEQTKIIGTHTARAYDMRSAAAQELEREIILHIIARPQRETSEHRARYEALTERLKRFYLVRESVVENLITTVGRSVLAQRLANTTTYTGIINYGALGSSSTAVANGDTQLGTEVFRKVTASTSFTTNTAFIDFFYAKADTNGTYQEFGTFIDGSAGANTGQMFTHALTGGWVKLSTESMTVSTQYTFS